MSRGEALSRSGWRRAAATPRRLDMASWGSAWSQAEEIYRPLTRRGRWLRTARRPLRALSTGVPTPLLVQDLFCEGLLEGASGLALMHGNAGRTIVGIATGDRLDRVLKVGSAADGGLRNEVEFLRGDIDGVRRPRLLSVRTAGGRTILELEAVDGFPTARIASVETAVEACVRLQLLPDPTVHGDLSPWNVMDDAGTPVLIDWERSRRAREPLTDLAHFVISREGHFRRRPRAERVVQVLTGEGGPGWRCLERLGQDPDRSAALVRGAIRSELRRQTAHAATAELYGAVEDALDRFA